MRTDRGMHAIPAVGMVGGYDQVITFFAYDRLDTIKKGDKKIVMEIVEK
jgi:hypothetical protein